MHCIISLHFIDKVPETFRLIGICTSENFIVGCSWRGNDKACATIWSRLACPDNHVLSVIYHDSVMI